MTVSQSKAAKRAFIRRTLDRLYERGITARDLMLWESAVDQAEDLYSDRRFQPEYTEPRETIKDRIESFEEIFGERDFAVGLIEDQRALLQEVGYPGFTKRMRQRADLYECFIGRGPVYGAYAG